MPTPTYTDTTLSNLIISKISQAKFNELKEEGLLNENELYLVENETLDALSNVIKNVGTPVLSSDAANKAYVDGKQVPVATTSVPGIVKPDGTTLSVDANGTLSVKTATSSTVGVVKPDNNTITIDANGVLSANIPIAGYNFNTVTLTSQTIDDVTTLCGELSNHAINIVQINSATTPVQLTMPAATSDGTARDFLLRMEITSSTVPMITFVPYTGDTLDFESLDGWTEFAPGINLLTFAETKPGA